MKRITFKRRRVQTMTVISLPEYTKEEVKDIKKKLRECKDEWLENKPKGGKYLGTNTIRQILDNATDYWDFTIQKEWKEEVYKNTAPKGQPAQWTFDGYVYHVSGEMFIPALGRRSQYGSKVAVGGKDNQDSAYKAAASNCLNKCASLFGVGSDVYSKIKIEEDESELLQQDPNYAVGQMPMQTGYVDYSQGYNPNGQQMPNQGVPPMQNQGWPQQEQQMYQPPVQQEQQMYQQPTYDQQPTYQQAPEQQVQDTIHQTNQTYQHEQVPFEQPPAQPNMYQANPQDVVVQYGAPALPKPEQVVAVEERPTPLEPVEPEMQVDNPWNQPHIINAMTTLHSHKERLSLTTNQALLPHIRNYFQEEKADMSFVTPENIMLFNDYLSSISA